MSKIAVIFPGMGYHSDKPLLYFARKLACKAGYEVVEVSYEFPFRAREIMNDKVRMKEAFSLAVSQIKEQLGEMSFDKYEDVVFVGKSIGTALAAYFDSELEIGARQVVFTPVPQTFDRIRKGAGIVFHGLADPWCDSDIAREKCAELELPLYKIERANHSLETDDPIEDLSNLKRIMEKVEVFFGVSTDS